MNRELQLKKIRKLIIKKYSDDILSLWRTNIENSRVGYFTIDKERHFSLHLLSCGELKQLIITVYGELDIIFHLEMENIPKLYINGISNKSFKLLDPFVSLYPELIRNRNFKSKENTLFNIIDWLRQVD